MPFEFRLASITQFQPHLGSTCACAL